MTTNLLEANGVTKRFGGLIAVNQASMTVRRGEITGLIGPNGAGKTTFFNLLSGFMTPDEGDIRFKGQRLNGMRPSNICKLGMTRPFRLLNLFLHLAFWKMS